MGAEGIEPTRSRRHQFYRLTDLLSRLRSLVRFQLLPAGIVILCGDFRYAHISRSLSGINLPNLVTVLNSIPLGGGVI